LRKLWLDWQWLIIVILIFGSLALGFAGFWRRASLIGEPISITDAAYLTIQLITLESGSLVAPVPWQLQVSRFLTPVITAYAALFALVILFREQFDLFRLRFWENHILICGFGRRGLLLAKAFKEQGYRVVAIEKDPHEGHIEHYRDLGIVVLIGDARTSTLLLQARAPWAKYVIAVCDDAVNVEIAFRTKELVRMRGTGGLTCFVDIVNLELCRLLREKETASPTVKGFGLEFVNVFELGARALLDEYSPFHGAVNSGKILPHVLIVGVGRFGESLILNMARDWKMTRPDESRLRISLVDRNAIVRARLIQIRQPNLDLVCDLSIHEMEVQSPEFQEANFLFDSDGQCKISFVCVCLDDDAEALSAALALNRQLKAYDHKIPIVVRMTEGEGMATMVPEETTGGEFDHLHAFRLLDKTCKPEMFCMGINEERPLENTCLDK